MSHDLNMCVQQSQTILYKNTRIKENLATILSLDNAHIDRKTSTKILGVWIEADPSCWAKNTKELIKRTYASMSMFTKLKFAGLSRTNLINIYCFLCDHLLNIAQLFGIMI